MARNSTVAECPAECVWEVLADPDHYQVWVVGAKEIRDWEGHWPQPGARFHHSQGFGPVTVVRDETEVVEAEPGRRLLLEARARPLVVLHIQVTLEAVGEASTRITLDEWPVSGPLTIARPLLEVGIRIRNVESLERLRGLSEQRWRGRRSALPAEDRPATGG